MNQEKLETAVLFLVFNRPDTTRQVFEKIKEIKPRKLYIAADGPRKGKNEEEECQKVKEILSEISWDCEVRRLYRSENLGCKAAVSGAIDWFFSHEELGIILEDDVLPHRDFFKYCEYMLKKYSDDERVMMITGSNHFQDESYAYNHFFSEHFSIWGWATWKRAWNLYNVAKPHFPMPKEEQDFLQYKFGNSYIYKHFLLTFESLYGAYKNTWDIQWVYACLLNNGLCVTPKHNLISNIGVSGTHNDFITDSHFIPVFSWESELPDPPNVRLNANYDRGLHNSKSRCAVRINLVKKHLSNIGLLNFVLMIKNLFTH